MTKEHLAELLTALWAVNCVVWFKVGYEWGKKKR